MKIVKKRAKGNSVARVGWVGAGGNGAGRAAGSGCMRGLAGLLQVCR